MLHLAIAVLSLCAPAFSLSGIGLSLCGPGGGDTPRGTFAVHCGKLYPGDGPPLTGAWIVVRDGKITEVREGGPAPAGLPVLDASDKVVMPGIVAADSDLSGHGDADYNVTPDFLALDGFDFVRRRELALSGGVTTAYLAPGRNRLVPGQGSVVKLFGTELVQRVVAESCALRLTFGAESTRGPALFEPVVSPTGDDVLEPARRQYPSARVSQLATLRELFADAARANGGLLGEGSAENHWDPEPLRRASSGALPLRIAVREAADVRRALAFARELGVRHLVLEDPFEIAPVAEQIAASGAFLVLRVPVAMSANNRGGENRRDEAPAPSPAAAAVAARAGIPVALAPRRDEDLPDYLMVAGIAIRHGLEPDQALRAVTFDAARALGVQDRVGSLRGGRDADFLVLSGEPFAIGTMVEQTFVDGVPAYERQTREGLLAVRAGRVMTAAGTVLRDGVVVAQGGVIRAVGEGLAVPYGAQLVDLPDAVVVPGFVDAFSTLGLSGDGIGIPQGAAEQRLGDVIRWNDPLFQTALRAGLTTALVAGSDPGGTVAGRIAAIKLGASAPGRQVLREIAGIRFVHDAIGPDAIKPLKDALERGKKYLEAWQKYEKAVADWKAGKTEKPPEAAPAPVPVEDAVSGTWDCTLKDLPAPVEITMTLVLKLEGTTVTGTVEIGLPGRKLPPADVRDGSFQNGELKLTARVIGGDGELVATVANDELNGSINAMGNRATVSGRRTSKVPGAASGPATADGGAPKKPNVDEALEPLRALYEKKATAVVRVDRGPAIADVLALFAEEKVPFVLHGAGDAVASPALLGDKAPPVLLGPELVSREKGEVVNAAARLADRGVPLAFGTGDALGSSYLPLHAAHAIRWGMDPDAALRALTIEPAKMFGIDDRVGSLQRGKDADFVVFSGNPFEMTSRVLLVVCDGRIVVDARDAGSNR